MFHYSSYSVLGEMEINHYSSDSQSSFYLIHLRNRTKLLFPTRYSGLRSWCWYVPTIWETLFCNLFKCFLLWWNCHTKMEIIYHGWTYTVLLPILSNVKESRKYFVLSQKPELSPMEGNHWNLAFFFFWTLAFLFFFLILSFFFPWVYRAAQQ